MVSMTEVTAGVEVESDLIGPFGIRAKKISWSKTQSWPSVFHSRLSQTFVASCRQCPIQYVAVVGPIILSQGKMIEG